MSKAFGPVGAEMLDRRLLVVERLIGLDFHMDRLGSLFRRQTALAIASTHKAKGKPVNKEWAAVIIVRFYRSATLFDSCA